MAEKSIVVIGAGLAGLATGCYAQMNGYQTRIFEHHTQPGGVAAAWPLGNYLIDGGIHFLMGYRPGQPIYDLYRELGIMPATRCVDINNYGCFVDEPTGRRVDVTADLDHLVADLWALSPADGRAVVALIATARSLRNSPALYDAGLASPPELASVRDRLGQFWAMRGVWRYFAGPYGRSVAEFARSLQEPMLRRLLENLFLPDVPVWFICMLLAMLEEQQLGLLEGGCLELVGAIERQYKALGGRVTYEATVEEILVERDRATGVRLAGGEEHRADVVVSAADGYSTIFQMLGGRYADDRTRRRYRTWELIRPSVMVSLGVAREFKGEPHLTMLALRQPIAVGGKQVDRLFVRLFNYSDRFAPAGKTVVQAGFESGWDYWDTLQRDRPRYESEKERVAAEIVARLEAYYPGIAGQVEETDVATPYTTWRYTLNHRGAYMGWLPTPDALMTAMPRTLRGLGSFYMAGQWVLPGGGVPSCLYSGRHLVQLLCRQDGRKFAVTPAPLDPSLDPVPMPSDKAPGPPQMASN